MFKKKNCFLKKWSLDEGHPSWLCSLFIRFGSKWQILMKKRITLEGQRFATNNNTYVSIYFKQPWGHSRQGWSRITLWKQHCCRQEEHAERPFWQLVFHLGVISSEKVNAFYFNQSFCYVGRLWALTFIACVL